jgi:phosphoribosylformimino-5-aminoimidazole carboxamide ribonucleotide (ProFAR) isomerase
VALYRELLAATDVPVVASGGVGTTAHIEALVGVEVAGRRLAGVIVGRALYEGAFTLAEALAATAPPPPPRP